MLMAAPWRGSMNPTAQERADRIDAHAMGRSHFEIAARFGISVQASKQFKAANRDEIAERARYLNGEVREETAQLWVSDQVALQELRQFLIEDTLARRDEADQHRDVSRYNRDIDQLALRASELAGLIKQRSQVEVDTAGKVTYEVSGIDLGEIARSWAEKAQEPEPVFEPPPVTAPIPGPMPEEFMGKEERQRQHYERKDDEPAPSSSAPSSPVSPIMEDVPEESRSVFRGWLRS